MDSHAGLFPSLFFISSFFLMNKYMMSLDVIDALIIIKLINQFQFLVSFSQSTAPPKKKPTPPPTPKQFPDSFCIFAEVKVFI